MSADVLRQAASLMRSRAEAATPGPWSNGDSEVSANGDLVYDDPRWPGQAVLPSDGPMEVAECYRHEARGERQANAAHIAAFHPAVALELAAFLDFAAAYGNQPEPQSPTIQFAMSIATAYLGTP